MKSYLLFLFLAANTFASLAFSQENKKDAKGLKQGAWVKIDANTKAKIYEGSFVDDKPTGLFKYYYPGGKTRALNTYTENGTKASVLLFDEKGNKIAEGIYRNEKKDSCWNYYNPDHVLIAQENYLNSQKNGSWKVFYENGNLFEETNWKEGVKDGKWNQFFKNSIPKTEGFYSNGELDGQLIFYFPDGKTEMTGTYVNARRDGLWVNYNESGEVKSREHYFKGSLVNKELVNGVFTENYDNEILKSSTTYKDGKKNGEFMEYYNAGEWKKRVKPAEGEFPAEEEQYVTGTKLKRKGNYVNDSLHGTITSYKPDGKIEKTEEYKHGNVISKK